MGRRNALATRSNAHAIHKRLHRQGTPGRRRWQAETSRHSGRFPRRHADKQAISIAVPGAPSRFVIPSEVEGPAVCLQQHEKGCPLCERVGSDPASIRRKRLMTGTRHKNQLASALLFARVRLLIFRLSISIRNFRERSQLLRQLRNQHPFGATPSPVVSRSRRHIHAGL